MAITQITNKFLIKIDECKKPNSIYLKWLETAGDWRYALFNCNKIEGMTTTASGVFSPTIADLNAAMSDSHYLSKNATPDVTMYADNLDANEALILKGLLYAPEVLYFIGETGKWQTVKIVPAKYILKNTKASLYYVEFTMQFVQINIQSQ